MNGDILKSDDRAAIRAYVDRKFRRFAGWAYPRAVRIRKTTDYWIAADKAGRDVVESVYFVVFKERFPVADALKRELQLERTGRKVEANEWADIQRDRLEEAETALGALNRMLKAQDYQEGESFFLQLQGVVAFLGEDVLNEERFSTEWEAKRVMELTRSGDIRGYSAEAEFDAMIGVKQSAKLEFKTREFNWGAIAGKLEESFQAGAWASGSAGAKMKALGFSSEVQLAVAMGAQLDVSGQLAWSKGDVGLELSGQAQCFLGGQASFEAKLSAGARGKFEASVAAGCFAGLKVEATGTCAFTYEGRALVSASGTVEVSVGAGASFEASIKSSLFGPTEISVESSLTAGVGGGAAAKLAIDFNGVALAGRASFRQLVYLPTVARGYRMDLINDDARNKFYLDKCLTRMKAEIEAREEAIAGFEKRMRKSPEKVSLLMG